MEALKNVQRIKGLSLIEKALLYAAAFNGPEGSPKWLLELVATTMIDDHMGLSEDDYDSRDKQLHRRLDAHARVLYRAMAAEGIA